MSEQMILALLQSVSGILVLAQNSGVSISRVSDLIRANGGTGLTDEQLAELKEEAKRAVANIGPKS
jgi:hypothetical protein